MSIYEYNEAEHMKMEREDAYETGTVDGQNRMLQLIQKMSQDGMAERIPNLTSPDFLEEMLSKYHLAD